MCSCIVWIFPWVRDIERQECLEMNWTRDGNICRRFYAPYMARALQIDRIVSEHGRLARLPALTCGA